jgi:DtxR family Mn-dependent transcriptional regulator
MKTERKSNSIEKYPNNISYKQLTECPIGQKLKVERVNAGFHAKRRLACLGIVPGVEIIKKKAAPFRGPVEVIVKGTSLVIGRGLASKIIIK